MRDLREKVAWITGAGTGIGEAGARALAAAGMRVVLSGRRAERLEEVAGEIGNGASVETLDVADKRAVAEVAERVLAAHGRLDVLVNSAGTNVKARNWHNVSVDDWDSVIELPPHVCINELVVSPTWNRFYVAQAQRLPP